MIILIKLSVHSRMIVGTIVDDKLRLSYPSKNVCWRDKFKFSIPPHDKKFKFITPDGEVSGCTR